MDEIHQTITQKWLDGISYEIAFWNNVYRWPHTFKGMMGWANYGSTIRLEGFDANEFLLRQEHPKVYDVGCGMSYAVGDYLEDNGKKIPLDIHYMDPLAFHFNKILKKYNKSLPKIELGMAEYLSAFIPGKDASLITIQNALDHSSAPVKGMVEALESLREGGILYLNHHPNEAEMEKYKGFHQYNVDEKEGQLIVWNKKEQVNVSLLLDGFASVDVKRMSTGHIVAIITKIDKEISRHRKLQMYVNDKFDKGELCQILLLFQFRKTSLVRNMKCSIKFGVFNILQFFAQMLSWKWKMRIKHLIKQA